ncbi:MAG: thiolase family protein [Actinomycetota bacterium]|nr:thiolase family protein [Actinomycetota bacterium]
MGLRGDAAVVGWAEWESERKHAGVRAFQLEQWADLAASALADAGIAAHEVNGLVCCDLRESTDFVPATIAEYCGWRVNFAERVDLGGASPVGMVWRAAAAIELGLCDVVVCAVPARPRPRPTNPRGPRQDWLTTGASSNEWGSPQAEFDIPYGNIAQNAGYAMIAQRYAAEFGWDERALAKIAADQRTSANANPLAVFRDVPLSIDDVLASKVVADPIHVLEIVMPCQGGAAIVVTSRDRAASTRHRPAFVRGFGEHLAYKTHSYADDLVRTPIGPAAQQAFAMSGIFPGDIDACQLYDCYTITVLLSLEDAGFCGKGEGLEFVRRHDLSYRGDFPVNTHGGQLGMGQPGMAGGMTQVVEAIRQIQGRAGERQLRRADNVFVSGTGGIMSEQSALILQGA